ncbi:GNAT family N-acetyltransferase [Sphingobium sp. SCG-1]|uniref:GNAT family N-acetyltransferase n=1 Tax=Sphingobium sp. SCG-1 TaxID=2072936 RepID=UPI000CD69A35|nr:GNAT family N-acetyltransferase [Sphingobium sp. SCG-1]AUW59932.1 GNAT family N-acetyltransferase [Sphingobium sp. SCG-1]
MTEHHSLDRPVWSALQSGWASMAVGDHYAMRLHGDFGPFAAAVDGSPHNAARLSSLLSGEEELWLVEADPPALPAGLKIRREATLHQMTASTITVSPASSEIVLLTADDAPDMIALAHLTVPGPFAARTYQLGRFLGVKEGGRLVAMAGERMRLPGYAEVSGVCTHPDHRGKGYAAALMRAVAQNMLALGETPFLHCYASNLSAIRLYESLGFVFRRSMHLKIVAR